MGKTLTILLFAALTFQASAPVQTVLSIVSLASSKSMPLEKTDSSHASIPCEEPASEGEASTEESETFHFATSGVIPSLLMQPADSRFSDLRLSPVSAPVLDDLKPPPQA